MERRIADGRRERLLDGVMEIVSARGFSDVRMNDMARELHCSLASLYKIAPNKDSLIVLAIGRWGERTLDAAESHARGGRTASERARRYYLFAAASVAQMSHAFRRDMERFESTRLAYLRVSDAFVDRFTELISEAGQAGEILPVNARFMAGVFRHLAIVIRDEELLDAAGLSAGEALLEVDRIVWGGLQNDCAPDANTPRS